MSDKKISELTNITGANLADADEFVVVDSSASETKAITWAELKEGLDTGTGFVRITGDTMTGDLSFGDNDKAIFGAGSDLQIYHSGSHSFIEDQGTGFLYIKTDRLNLQNAAGTENLIQAISDGAVNLYYDNAPKLATTSTGVDVTGTITSDGLTTSGVVKAPDGSSSAPAYTNSGDTDGGMYFPASNQVSFASGGLQRLNIGSGGDISFYEDTGTTAKFFWDASAEGLNIGGNINYNYNINAGDLGVGINSTGVAQLVMRGTEFRFQGVNASPMKFYTSNIERLRIDASGNVGIGTSSPNFTLEAKSSGGTIIAASTSGATSLFRGFAVTDGAVEYASLKQKFDDGELRLTSGLSGWGGFTTFHTNGSERMRIDLSGNVGIGISSPASGYLGVAALDVEGPVLARGAVISHHTNAGVFQYISNETTIRSYGATAGSGQIVFTTGGGGSADTERMRIDSSGNVGIGTSSPSSYHSPADNLVIGSSGDNGLTIVSGTSSGGTICFADGTSGGAQYAGFIDYQHNGNYMRFGTNVGTERMRIDASGNLLVGTTTTALHTSATESGVRAGAAGPIMSAGAGTVAYFNRNGGAGDGTIVDFRKDGAPVGSIGTSSFGNFRIHSAQTSHVGLEFGSPNIMPTNNSGVLTDGGAALGSTSYRFRDLYLSGGVYLGGSTSANLLDDYEEGTFTPVLTTDATAPSLTASVSAGRYTKVGNTVNIWIYISVSALASAGTGNAIITGLPFTCGDLQGGVNSNWAAENWATAAPTAGHIAQSATSILLVRYDGAGTTRTTASNFDSSFEIVLHGSYRTA